MFDIMQYFAQDPKHTVTVRSSYCPHSPPEHPESSWRFPQAVRTAHPQSSKQLF